MIDLIEDFGATHILDNKLLVNDRDLPIYENIRTSGEKYAKEIRGIWEAEESFMGGPFIAYLIKENNSDQLIFMFSFIYSPGNPKRNLIQRNEVIMRGIQFYSANN